jgi:hypothetical protein
MSSLKLFVLKDQIPDNVMLLKVAGILFGDAVILNFFSQHTGHITNTHECEWATQELLKETNDIKYNQTAHEFADRESQKFNRYTDYLNYAATLIMFAAIMLTAFFFAILA